MEQQSREVSRDLAKRSYDYLQSIDPGSPFILQKGSQFDLVEEEALYQWIIRETSRELQLPYDQIIRIRNQIRNYPAKLQWSLDVGGGWTIKRNGETLSVFNGRENKQCNFNQHSAWIIVSPDDHSREGGSDEYELSFNLPPDTKNSNITIGRVKECGNIKFTPPWRSDRSAIKVKKFLRGQQVPLHRRDETTILCLSDNAPIRHALAVYLEDADEWIVNAEFCPRDEMPVTTVVLRSVTCNN